jgi:fibulin 1/2
VNLFTVTVNQTYADVDECADGISECDQTCHNNIGSYTCSCDAGFTLNDDRLHCDGN